MAKANKKIENVPQPEKELSVVLTIVPQDQMVRPRSYIATISTKSLSSFIGEEVKKNLKKGI